MKTKILLAFIAFIPSLAVSQEAIPTKENPYIEVVGSGEM